MLALKAPFHVCQVCLTKLVCNNFCFYPNYFTYHFADIIKTKGNA